MDELVEEWIGEEEEEMIMILGGWMVQGLGWIDRPPIDVDAWIDG